MSARNIIGSLEYRALFDTRLAEDSQAKGKWHTSAGGIYYAVGIGGSVLGRGGDVILIDDPYSSMEDALSEVTRKNVWEWYTGTAYNRLMPKGAIVVINHRMHEDDLSGRLLAQQAAGGDIWGRLFEGGDGASHRDNDVDLPPHELGGDFGHALGASLRPTILDCDGPTLDPTEFMQSLHKGSSPRTPTRSVRAQDPDSRQLPRPCSERPRRCRTTDKPDELPPPHAISLGGEDQ